MDHASEPLSTEVLQYLDALYNLARWAPHPGDRGVMIALGPGFAAEWDVLQW